MRKSIKSIMAFALAATLAASTLAPATTAAAASKQNVITKATTNGGTTTKYSYNKKGLISKSVASYSSKDDDSDYSKKTTTTFKYNKKNKLASKTAKTVEKTTSYETDKTTGLKIVATNGTVTTTTTAVTKFTYNKKGLATQAETTTTTSKSGSTTSTSKESGISNGWYDDWSFMATELSDGKILAGYNQYDATGKYIYGDERFVAANAYYYSVPASTGFAIGETTKTTKTDYKDNGNGSYKAITTTTTSDSGIKMEPVYQYYASGDNGAPVPITKLATPVEKTTDEWTDEDGIKHTSTDTYYYQAADGKLYQDYWYRNITTVNVTADPKSSSSSTSVDESDVTNKTVTTTKYTYDKKKRAKKAVTTTVKSNNSVSTTTYNGSSTNSNSSGKSDSVTKSENESERTVVTTTTYSYNKKGHATKVVSSNDGKEQSSSKESSMTVSSNSETTYYNDDGTVDRVEKKSSSTDTYPTTTSTVVANGEKTVTVISNPYTETYANSTTFTTSANSDSGTKKYTTYANGGNKVENAYTSSYTSTTYPESNYSSTGTSVNYRFDKDGKVTGYQKTGTRTNASGTNPDNSASYTENGTSVYNLDAAVKLDAAKAALEASGSPYADSKKTTVLATPSKTTTVYKYDKSGNVKSATATKSYVATHNVYNETYGNQIYEFDATGELQEKQISVTHKDVKKSAMDNVVKKGTKSLTKVVTATSETKDRAKSSGSSLSRVLFSVKSKKGSSNAAKQQWNIQNGSDDGQVLNGEVGLN